MSEKDKSIERREFLKAGAATAAVAGAAGAAGLAGSSCAGLFSDGAVGLPRLQLPDMDSYLERVDEGLEFISSTPWSDDSTDEDREDPLDAENGLGRKVLRSLFLAGMFGDLPDEGQAHPGMQARVKRALPEMDEALDGAIEYLSSVDDDQVAELQQFLKRDYDPGMAIAEHLDQRIADTGASTKRRMQSRSMITQVVSRLKNQPPRQLFDEYLGKVGKQAALAGTVAESERYMVAQLGERAFWERQQRLAMAAARWQDEGAADGDSVPDVLPADLPADAGVPADDTDAGPAETAVLDAGPGAPISDELEQAIAAEREALSAELVAALEESAVDSAETKIAEGELRIRRGGWVLGIGAVTSAVGLVLACTEIWFVGGILGTAAAVLFIIALVLIIRGAHQVREGRESA